MLRVARCADSEERPARIGHSGEDRSGPRWGDTMIGTGEGAGARSAASVRAGTHLGMQAWLTERIIAGEIAPGSRLYDARLATAFGADTAEVRRALDGLAAVGLVAVRRDGTRRVTAFEEDRARDVVAMFGDVWIGSVRHAMTLLRTDDLAYLGELVDDVTSAVRTRDVAEFGAALRALAVAFARIEGNTERAEMLGSLGVLLERVARRAGSVFEWVEVRAAIVRIAHDLSARDAAALRAALIALFDEVLPAIVDRAVARSRPLAVAS